MTTLDFARFLNIRTAYAPNWNPDGRRLLFVTDMTGVPQVWSLDAPLSWPTQVTFGPDRYFYAKSDHKSGRAILSGDVGGNENLQLALLSADGVAATPLDYSPDLIHSFGGWSPDDKLIAFSSNRRDSAYFDIYTLAVDEPGAAPKMVFQSDGTNLVEAWMPDGSALIVVDKERPMNENLYLVPLDGGAPRHLTPHEGEAVYMSVQPSPNGKTLYMVSDGGLEYLALVSLDLDSGDWNVVAAPDWDVDSCALTPDGKGIAYDVNTGGYSDLVLLDLATGVESRPEGLPRGVIMGSGAGGVDAAPALVWSPDGTRLAFNFQSPTRNLDVWVWDLGSAVAEPWTRSGMAALPTSTFVEPELIAYSSFDGRNIPAFLFLPADSTAPAPCVVYVHGGPEGQTQASFSSVMQYFVHRGYAVLAPNVRGSTGYGREYTHLDDVRLRMDSVKDLAAAVDWLRESDRVAPEKIAVMGGSYGGFMVLAAITAYPELWAAAVDIVGIANFETFLRNTAPWRRPLREAEYGSLEHDLDFLREVSPIRYVAKITAPLLVIHGANDPRVPVGEAEQMVETLRGRQHPVDYLVFDDEGHGVVKLKNRLVAYPAIGDFLDKHLRGEARHEDGEHRRGAEDAEDD